MSGNFVHCKRERQRIVYIYSIHVCYICKQYAAAGACSARNLSRHFWAAYAVFEVTTFQSTKITVLFNVYFIISLI